MRLGERYEERLEDGRIAVATVGWDPDQGTPYLECDDGDGRQQRRAATTAELEAWRASLRQA